MKARRIAWMGLAGLVLSGCAGGQTRQQVTRLQSQVGLLEERVGQLERANLTGVSDASFNEPSTNVGVSLGVSTPSKTKTSSDKTSAIPSAKPTTREIQQALKNAGFYQGTVDGKMGAVTRDAIKEFQRVHGLTDDGVVGRRTWAKLRAYTDLTAPTSGEANTVEALK